MTASPVETRSGASAVPACRSAAGPSFSRIIATALVALASSGSALAAAPTSGCVRWNEKNKAFAREVADSYSYLLEMMHDSRGITYAAEKAAGGLNQAIAAARYHETRKPHGCQATGDVDIDLTEILGQSYGTK
jgi:hypothetical protein